MMKYLIIYKSEAFYTNRYSFENDYANGMIVVDIYTHKITFDGQTWKDIEEDSL